MVFAPPPGLIEGALGALLWILGLVGLLVFFIVRRIKYAAFNRREGQAWCRQCKYALTAPWGDRCPECGAALTLPSAVVLRRSKPSLSWSERLFVLSVVVWYPFLAPVYLMLVNDAMDDWFVHRSSRRFSNPPSQQYEGFIVDAEWIEFGPILDGEIRVTLDGVRSRGSVPTAQLVVDVADMEASFEERGRLGIRRERPVSAAFVMEWMRAQGVDVDAPPSDKPQPRIGGRGLGMANEAQAIVIEIERRGGALPVADADKLKSGDAVFNGWGGGSGGPRCFWRPWWYWPVALTVVATLWTGLAFAVRPRNKRSLPYPSPA